jgi:hypothetical protein
MGVRGGQCGQQSVQTALPSSAGLEPKTHHISSIVHYSALTQPYGKPGTVDMTVSLSFLVQMLAHCPDEDVRQTGHIHPSYPSRSVADITDYATHSRIKNLTWAFYIKKFH